MKSFTYQKAESADAAIGLIAQNAGAKFLGGGTNLVDLMRENIEQPGALVDVTNLSKDIEELENGAVKIGAAAKNTQVANDDLIREKYPFLSQAILFGASGQIRNMATVGGNLLQRTRCYYFYDDAANCNKRKAASGCDALEGFNRIHAILGTSGNCIATHPSDMCVALAALDAKIFVEGGNGKREINFIDFHKLPDDTPQIETELRDGELITHIEIPKVDFAKNSLYRKVRDRASYAFALVSVAATLEIQNNEIKNVRIALGGVAHKPWRAFEAENFLAGKEATEENFRGAAETELQSARGFEYNSFKIELAKRTIVSVLKELAEKGEPKIMSLMQKIMETVVQFVPDKEPDPLIRQKHGYVGKPLSRVDGQLKVKGAATFSAEFKFDNLAYAALVYASIANGVITKINSSEAEKAAGVIKIITHENAPKLKAPPQLLPVVSDLPIFQDAEIQWSGQPIAVVVAETQDQAEAAANLIRVEYEAEAAALSFDALKSEAVEQPDFMGFLPLKANIGDAEDALGKAEFRVDQVYRTPFHTHNAIEPHATIAAWDEGGENLTVFDTTQMVYMERNMLAKTFDLDDEQVRVIAPFVGGGFGGKPGLWGATLSAMAAHVVKRPVKLALSREGVFRTVGGRSLTEQRVAFGAERNGKFTAILHTGTSAKTAHGGIIEPFSFATQCLYGADNIHIEQKSVDLNMANNGFMRAPGEAPGTFALESAIDELAYELKIDPIELRKINEPAKDPTTGHEFSMRNLTEAYRRGAEKFGWKWQAPRSQKDGKWLVGQGAATATYPYQRMQATARVRISNDGTALIQTATHEMGMGTATVQIQHAAERLGLPIDKVSFEYGDSNLPEAGFAGGSNQTATNVAAIAAAVEKFLRELLALAGDSYDSPLSNLKYEDIEARDGGLFSKKDSSKGETYEAILKRIRQDYIETEATSGQPLEMMKYSMHSYGAQFCEVRVNEETGETRVSRFLGSFDCGTILNPKTATSQFRGGIIMGIGMALTEETMFDERSGRIMNPSLAEYHVPVHLDIPHIEIIWNDIPDEHSPLGAHGIGEIGITGVAAAIANAVYNATGKRIRELPITLDKLL